MAMLHPDRRIARGAAIVATLRTDTIVALLALVELGIPVTLLHPRLTASERTNLVGMIGGLPVLDETWQAPPPETGEGFEPPPPPADEAPLAVLFTSGSSGTPKGVELSRRAFAASAEASASNLGFNDDDRWLLCMPLGHVGGLSVVLRCLAARVGVVLSPWSASLDAVLADVESLGVTLLSLVPTMLARILEADPSYRFPPAVRAVLLGGDAAPPALLRKAAERGVPVVTTYGMTETCSQVATLPLGIGAAKETGVGRPLPGAEVRIVDGEINVRGPMLFTRYVPAERFPTPRTAEGFFPTGDLGHLDDSGFLHVDGRRSDMLITGGENVDPREVETAIAAVPGVRAACVFGVPDDVWGQVIAVAIVADDPQNAGHLLGAVAAHAGKVLAAHKRPRLGATCVELVLNATGKLDRKRTAEAVRSSLVPLSTTRGTS